MAIRSAIAIAALLLSGCAAAPLPAIVPLPVPPLPALPTVTSAEADRINGTVWARIAERDILLRSALGECRAILQSTRAGAPWSSAAS